MTVTWPLGSTAPTISLSSHLSTTALGVPCLTVRHNTERPVTVEVGTNTLVGTDPAQVVPAAVAVLEGRGKKGRVPDLWDGRAAERIARILVRSCEERGR